MILNMNFLGNVNELISKIEGFKNRGNNIKDDKFLHSSTLLVYNSVKLNDIYLELLVLFKKSRRNCKLCSLAAEGRL